MNQKATPLTTEELHALREYMKEMQALQAEEPEQLTAEQWDEAWQTIQATGVVPPKYADRIGVNPITERKHHFEGDRLVYDKGEQVTNAYYDIVHEAWNAKVAALNKKYHDEIVRALNIALFEMESDNSMPQPVNDLIQSVVTAYTMPNHNLPTLGALTNASEFNTLNRILLSNGALKKSTVTRSEKITTERRTDDGVTTVRYTRSNRGDKHIITITNADVLLKKNNRHIKKLLPFTLQKMQQQSFPSKVAVDLEELVSLGMYSTTDNAWRGLSAFAKAMENIDIHWQRKVTTRKATKNGDKATTTTVEEGGVLIYHRKRRQNIGYLSVNEEFPIAALAREYTVFPSWAYALPIKAFDLALYIFYVARMQKDDILNTGGFNLSLQAIHERLGLPTVKEVETKMNRKYKERIRQPIEEAIEAIEEAVLQSDAAGKFFITPMTNDDADIKEWLQGYIRIDLKEEYAATFRTIADHKQKKIEAAEKAKIKAIAEAEAKKEAEKSAP